MGMTRVVESHVRSVIKVEVSTGSCERDRDRVTIEKVVVVRRYMVGSTDKS